jgi:hypothetical protein
LRFAASRLARIDLWDPGLLDGGRAAPLPFVLRDLTETEPPSRHGSENQPLATAIRRAVFRRARRRCQAGGRWDALEVHHVVKRAQGGSDFDLDRLVALCPP